MTCVYTEQIYSYSNTSTKDTISTRNTKWHYSPAAYQKHLPKSGEKKYINTEKPNIITTQANLLQVAQNLRKELSVETNKIIVYLIKLLKKNYFKISKPGKEVIKWIVVYCFRQYEKVFK